MEYVSHKTGNKCCCVEKVFLKVSFHLGWVTLLEGLIVRAITPDLNCVRQRCRFTDIYCRRGPNKIAPPSYSNSEFEQTYDVEIMLLPGAAAAAAFL